MGSLVQDRRQWQEVVAEKRRLQAESLAFVSRLELKDCSSQTSEDYCSIEGSEVVARLARVELSCESLVASHIKKLVRFNQKSIAKKESRVKY